MSMVFARSLLDGVCPVGGVQLVLESIDTVVEMLLAGCCLHLLLDLSFDAENALWQVPHSAGEPPLRSSGWKDTTATGGRPQRVRALQHRWVGLTED